MPGLEEAVKAFEIWRLERKSKNEPIPERLWSMAKELVPYYKKAHIQKALRLSGGQFNKYCMTADDRQLTERIAEGFAVGAFVPKYAVCNEVCALTLKGAHKSLEIKITIQNLAPVLSLVEGYL